VALKVVCRGTMNFLIQRITSFSPCQHKTDQIFMSRVQPSVNMTFKSTAYLNVVTFHLTTSPILQKTKPSKSIYSQQNTGWKPPSLTNPHPSMLGLYLSGKPNIKLSHQPVRHHLDRSRQNCCNKLLQPSRTTNSVKSMLCLPTGCACQNTKLVYKPNQVTQVYTVQMFWVITLTSLPKRPSYPTT